MYSAERWCRERIFQEQSFGGGSWGDGDITPDGVALPEECHPTIVYISF